MKNKFKKSLCDKYVYNSFTPSIIFINWVQKINLSNFKNMCPTAISMK